MGMFYNSTTYLRGFSSSSPCSTFLPERFFKFPLHVLHFYNLPERVFTLSLHILHSQVYQRVTSSLSTILHPSIYQEIYISSPKFYIPPRNIGFLSTFLHSTTYNEQPTHPNSRNKIKNEAFNNQENLAKRRKKNSRTNIFKIPPYNLLGSAKF